ncbi:MAG TPA: TIGR01777 family oxidoreductase [Gemmata sp.]
MKIVIPGGSGQVGTILARHFTAHGHEVAILSRKPEPAPWRSVLWDAQTFGPWVAELEGAGAVINLVGRTVNCRYTSANRHEILESRVKSVQLLGAAIAKCVRPPRVWLQASTATIYAHRYDRPNDEFTGAVGTEPDAPDTWKFSFDVATRWEQALSAVSAPHTRRVAMRAAITLSPDPGGAFAVLLGLVRKGLGGRAGDGRQFVSWVHDYDFVAAVEFLIRRDDLSGPINIAAPEPLPNADFMRGLRTAWGVRFGAPAARWMVEVGAWLLRTESELVLKSRRVVPRRLMEAGFAFRFPAWPEAARDLCERWRRGAPA